LLDRLYARAAGARRRFYERHPHARRCLRQPVLSVGNMSVGGTGKTPLVQQIAEWLLERGERPAILSRGYKRQRTVDGVVVVSDGRGACADLAISGDEPLMLARALPQAIVCVAEDRYTAGVLAEQKLGATVHVLDDGFQHVQLARSLDILVTMPGEITQGRVLPFGRLREAATAAARAHFVIVVGADVEAARREAWELGISQFAAAQRAVAPSYAAHLAAPGGQPALAVAGIGNPEQFFAMLRAHGVPLAGTLAFRDHHAYTPRDLDRIATAARDANAAAVLTTAKDLVRLEALAPFPVPFIDVRMVLDVQPWEALTATIEQALVRAGEAA
jgi:tetraacyldisaccharide 4'-kinase